MPALRSLLDAARAQVALLRTQRRLRTQPIGSLTIREPAGAGAGRTGDPLRARAIARAVARASRYGVFRPFCLVQTLALQELLVREGIYGSEIRIGVRRRDGAFAAHAWVRWGDEILGDDPRYIATFTEVDDIRVLGSG